jgi:DNA-directed RNA polymerase subunit RPC12/RpoP
MKLPEKVAYLKGLMDGMKIDETSDNGKLFSCISEILEDVALQIEDLQDQVDEVVEAVDDIDGDLSEINEFMFGDDFDDDDDSDDLDLFSSDDDILALVEDYDGIGEEMFDEEDDDEEIDLSDIEPFDDDTDDLPEAFEIDREDDDDSIDEIDSISSSDADFIEEDDEQLETEELYEVICPTCKDKIHLTESMLATGSIDCPGCGEHLEFDLSDEG